MVGAARLPNHKRIAVADYLIKVALFINIYDDENIHADSILTKNQVIYILKLELLFCNYYVSIDQKQTEKPRYNFPPLFRE